MGFSESVFDFDSVLRSGGRSPGAYHFDYLTTRINFSKNTDSFYKVSNDRVFFNDWFNEPISIYKLNGALYKKDFVQPEFLFSDFAAGIYILTIPSKGVSFKFINP